MANLKHFFKETLDDVTPDNWMQTADQTELLQEDFNECSDEN